MTLPSTLARVCVSISATAVGSSREVERVGSAATIAGSEGAGALGATIGGAGAGVGAGVGVGAAATCSATGGTCILDGAGGSAGRGWASRSTGAAAGGLGAAGGGATTTTGRDGATTPAGALATTGPAGGREAMAGGAGGATMAGADRGWGTILRGSGLPGCGGTTVTGGAIGAAGTVGRDDAGGGGGAAFARACARFLFASASSFSLVARMAFITSPGLEMWERSILGTIVCAAREGAALVWPPDRDPRS
jgi:hypothetical protein